MSRVNPKLIQQLAQASMAGIMLAACIFIGTGLGVWLDRHLATKPWLTFLGMLMGIIAGFYNVARIVSALGNKPRGQ